MTIGRQQHRVNYTDWLVSAVILITLLVLLPFGTLPFAPGAQFSDAAISHWPSAHFLRESVWTHHEWPLWNPLRMLGQPFAANPLNKVWYPPQWLVLVLPPTIHLNIMIYGHMALLAMGLLRWGRSEGLPLPSLALIVTAISLNPKLIGHLGAGHLDILYGMSWVPWVMIAGLNTITKTSTAGSVALAAAAAMLVLADVRIAFYMLPLTAIFTLGKALGQPHQASGVASWALMTAWMKAALLCGLLTAVQLLPLVAIGPYLTRSELEPHEAAIYSLPVSYLVGVLIADNGGFHEYMTYLGLPIVALAASGLLSRHNWHKPRYYEFGVKVSATLIALLWALGDQGPLYGVFTASLPFLSWIRVPSRAWFVVVISLAFLAGLGLKDVTEKESSSVQRLAWAGLAFGGVIWLAIIPFMIRPVPSNLVGFGLAAICTGGSLWLLSLPDDSLKLSKSVRTAPVLLTLLASLVWVNHSLLEGRPLETLIADDQHVLSSLKIRDCQRVYSPSFDLLSPAVSIAGISTLHGVDPFQLEASAGLIARAAGVPEHGYSITTPPLDSSDSEAEPSTALSSAQPDAELLSTLGVGWIAARFPLEESSLEPVETTNHLYLYEISAKPENTIEQEAVNLESTLILPTCPLSPNRAIDSAFYAPEHGQGTIATPLQVWLPGWKAKVDGASVQTVMTEEGLVGVEIPPGLHSVELVYRPTADLAGIMVTSISLGVVSLYLLSASQRKSV